MAWAGQGSRHAGYPEGCLLSLQATWCDLARMDMSGPGALPLVVLGRRRATRLVTDPAIRRLLRTTER